MMLLLLRQQLLLLAAAPEFPTELDRWGTSG